MPKFHYSDLVCDFFAQNRRPGRINGIWEYFRHRRDYMSMTQKLVLADHGASGCIEP